MDIAEKVYCALDDFSVASACELVQKIADSPYAPSIRGYKIHDLWDREGPGVVARLKKAGAPRVWVDLKLHDVPATVRLRAKAVRDAGGDLVTVHIPGGIEMMQAACESGLEVLGITVLTSLTEEETHLDSGNPAKATVLQRARLAALAGIYGVVCSAHEVGILAKRPELQSLRRVVPGIRIAGKGATDENQKRVDTPVAALAGGASAIVLGSALTKAPDPVAVLAAIATDVGALAEARS